MKLDLFEKIMFWCVAVILGAVAGVVVYLSANVNTLAQLKALQTVCTANAIVERK